MPVTDIRIQISFLNHPKRLKLQSRLGAEGVLALINLWLWTGQNKWEGLLNGMDAEDIKLASQYTGDGNILLRTLIDLRFIDETPDGLRLHDWTDHNHFAATFTARSEQSKRAVELREEKRSSNRSSNRSSVATSPLPLPSPSLPIPKDNILPPTEAVDAGSKKPALEEKPKKSRAKPVEETKESYQWLEYFKDQYYEINDSEPNLSKEDVINAYRGYDRLRKLNHSDNRIRSITRYFLKQKLDWLTGHKPHLLFKHFDRFLQELKDKQSKREIVEPSRFPDIHP